MTNYTPITTEAQSELAAALAFLSRSPLASVRYRFTAPEDVGESRLHAGVVSCIDAIELIHDEGAGCVLTWAVDGWETGMAIVEPTRFQAGEATFVDATREPEWAGCVGSTVNAIYPAWQETAKRDALWALRLSFAGADVVVAIGAVEGPTMVDELVVTSDAAIATSLAPPAARTSAWGDATPLGADGLRR